MAACVKERSPRHHISIRSIIQAHARAQIKVVLVCISHEGVPRKRVEKALVEIEKTHYIELQGIELIEEFPSAVSVVAVRHGNDVPGVFRTALVVI